MSDLQQSLLEYGLYAGHSIALGEDELNSYGFSARENTVLLVGNRGSSYWPVFSQSAEYCDGKADPLDRWSKRVAEAICIEHQQYRPLYPSDGPPYLPFQRWAMAAESIEPSPLGLLIHPSYGLWFSFRFALLFNREDDPVGVKNEAADAPPCRSCPTRPCLNSCPVNAFTSEGYDYLSCAQYLKNNPTAECHELGCQARNACPAATGYRYDAEQHRFHLQAFLSAH